MTSNIYYNFSKDLHSLFCTTAHKGIEGLFVRMANATGDDFLNWFVGANLARLNIGSKVVGALRCAARLRSQSPQVDISKISRYFLDNQGDVVHLATLQAMAQLGNDPRVAEILAPIHDILSVSGAWRFRTETGAPSPDLVDPESIVDDLVRIKNAYNDHVNRSMSPNAPYDDDASSVPHKENKQEKIFSLFVDLLKKFTQELTNAAQDNGQDALAQYISRGGIVQPMELQHFFARHDFDLSRLGADARYVIKTIIKNINNRTSEDQYNFIRNRALLRGNVIDESTYRNYYLQKSMGQDVASLLGHKPVQTESPQTISVQSKQLVQDDVLIFISLVLFGIHQHVI